MATNPMFPTKASIEFNYSELKNVFAGACAPAALARLVERLAAQRVLLVASTSLSLATDEFAELQSALGSNFAGLLHGIGPHTPRPDVMRILAAARDADADLLVSLGGGSIIDACKVVQLAIDQGVESQAQLIEYAQYGDGTRGSKYADFSLFKGDSKIRQVAIPTTLSGAEFSNNASVLNTEISAKEGYRGIDLCPQTIIYDPQLSLHTPQWLWLSTAIRSLDHAVEGYCSADSHAFLDGHFLHAMRLFASSLPECKRDPTDLSARSLNQQAVWLACCGLGTVSHGASHGIGYILGSLCGVPHGYTSCVMLPAVLAWNAKQQTSRQEAINDALGNKQQNAAASVKALVASLGLPTSLRDVDVTMDQLPSIAHRAAKHPVVRNNPRKVNDANDVMEILELAW
ncbi:MAG: iron-containing alcohol dehydrogenase [Gammaproteobacteria bacterium]|jgi:maleylacetate reductase